MPDVFGNMRVSPDYQRVGLFLFAQVGDIDTDGAISAQPVGTAFLIGEPLGDTGKVCPWLVTARHVIDNTIADERLFFRVRDETGAVRNLETPNAGWIRDITSDTAFVRLNLGFSTGDLKWVPLALVATPEYLATRGITTGDLTFSIALAVEHYGTHHDLPVVRFGRVSMLSAGEITFATREGFPKVSVPNAHLVEAWCWPGQSGAPVFVQPPTELVVEDDGSARLHEFQPALLGITCGHLLSNEVVKLEGDLAGYGSATVEMNRGLTVVTPITALLEAMTRPEHVAWRSQEIERLQRGP